MITLFLTNITLCQSYFAEKQNPTNTVNDSSNALSHSVSASTAENPENNIEINEIPQQSSHETQKPHVSSFAAFPDEMVLVSESNKKLISSFCISYSHSLSSSQFLSPSIVSVCFYVCDVLEFSSNYKRSSVCCGAIKHLSLSPSVHERRRCADTAASAQQQKNGILLYSCSLMVLSSLHIPHAFH